MGSVDVLHDLLVLGRGSHDVWNHLGCIRVKLEEEVNSRSYLALAGADEQEDGLESKEAACWSERWRMHSLSQVL